MLLLIKSLIIVTHGRLEFDALNYYVQAYNSILIDIVPLSDQCAVHYSSSKQPILLTAHPKKTAVCA